MVVEMATAISHMYFELLSYRAGIPGRAARVLNGVFVAARYFSIIELRRCLGFANIRARTRCVMNLDRLGLISKQIAA